MKIVKRILIGLAILIAIPLVIALFVKKDYSIVREITINQPKEVVFDYLKLLKNQDNFSKWAKMDPAMEKTYTGTDGTVGFIAAWKSNADSVGQGEQEIVKITPGEKIDYELRFIKPFKSVANVTLATEATGAAQTKVSWNFYGKTPYPFNFICLFMNMDEMIGKDLSIGLSNLKEILEKK